LFLHIGHLFISWNSVDPNIKNSKICLPIMVAKIVQKATCLQEVFFLGGVKTCKRQHPFFKREYFVTNILLSKKHSKKIIHYFFKKIISIIIIIVPVSALKIKKKKKKTSVTYLT
jgi:hypothetical protein